MKLEERLANYVESTGYGDLSIDIIKLAKFQFLNIIGTTVGGSTTEGCGELVKEIRGWGGREDATILLYGGKVPAHNAAFVNAYMARALESDDGVRPGLHVGAAMVPAALAAAELAGGCSGKDFITALVLGAEVAGRINSVSKYDGHCPTGSCGVFTTTVAASKILGLSAEQVWNAMGIAYSRSGGSPQLNRDGALAVRIMQGFVAQEGLIAAQLARQGFTGADNFLEGDLGFFKLFARGEYDPEAVAGELGERFEYRKTMFKMYPCCGSAISSVEAVLDLLAEHDGITPENTRQVKVKLTPYSAHIVDSPLRIGKNPRVDGQYNVRYCVANALLRRGCKLEHFEADAVAAPEIMELVKKIEIVPDHALDERDETAVDLEIITNDGKSYQKSIDYAGGFPERPLTEEQRFERFMSYISYGKRPLEAGTVDKIIATVNSLETLDDVRALIPMLLW